MIKLTMLYEEKRQAGDKLEVEEKQTAAWVNPQAIEAIVKLATGNTHIQLRGASLIVKEDANQIAEAAKKNEKAKSKKSS